MIEDSKQSRAVAKLESAQQQIDVYGKIETITNILMQSIEEVRAGTLEPRAANSISALCTTLIKALETARGNAPAVHVTAQLSRDEIEEIIHGRDPFRTTTVIATTAGSNPADGTAPSQFDDPLQQAGG